MPPGLTSTGAVLEAMVIPALRLGGYQCDYQQIVGVRIGGRKHKVDVIAVSNTTLSRPGLADTVQAKQGGGLSGRPLLHRSTAMLARTRPRFAGKNSPPTRAALRCASARNECDSSIAPRSASTRESPAR